MNLTVRSERDSLAERVPFGVFKHMRSWVVLAPFTLFVAVFLLWPTFSVFRSALQPVEGSSKPAMLEAISGQYLDAILYSVRLSALTAGLGAVIGTLVAVSAVSLNQFKGLRNVLVGYSAVAANLGGIHAPPLRSGDANRESRREPVVWLG